MKERGITGRKYNWKKSENNVEFSIKEVNESN